MLPDGSGIESAAATPGVPTFTSAELHKQLDAVLGKGASGTVYSLRGFPGLAAKEIRLDGLDQRSIDAARLELATLPTLSHPGILRYHQVIEDESFVYIVMDRHDGTLECLLIEHKRKKTRVSSRLICSIARQVAGALAYLSSASGTDTKGKPFRGLVHRDLKPANVLVAADGEQFILADFGLCKDALRSGTTLAGTKPYMAPETLLYNSTSPASDIWALGVIVYELATLKRPNFLEGREPKDVFTTEWKPDLSDVKNDFIRAILERIFVLDPEKRPTAKELAELLQEPNVPAIELKAPTNALDERCKSLEAALNGVNARLELLESSLKAKTDEIGSLREVLATKSAEIGTLESTISTQTSEMDDFRKKLEMKSNQIDALEAQCKEHLAMMKALENKIALLTANSPQSGLFLLSRLMRAAHTNNIEAVRVLVEGGDGIGKRDEQGMTALMHAAQQGHIEPVRLLVEKEKGLRDRSGWTALMHAVHGNHPGVVEILAARECGKRDSSGNTALMLAASNAHIETVRVLVEREKGIKDKDGHTALIHAARAGHREIAELLMEHEKGVTGWTMLMCAAYLGDTDMVSQYIDKRGQKDREGRTALIIAAQNRRDDAVKFLMAHEGGVSGWTRLIYSAYLGDVDAVRDSIHRKGCKDIIGLTALMWAAHRGHTEVVRILVEEEGGMQAENGWTALMFAAREKRAGCIKLLLAKEGGVQDNNGWTALMWAAQNGHADCVKLLLEREGGMQKSDGWTALMIAADNGHADCARLLLEREGGMQKSDGWTALMIAADNGHADCVKLLLEREGGMKESDGWTALMIAAENGYAECVRLLAEREKNIRSTHEWNWFPPGTTALDIAKEREYSEIISIICNRSSTSLLSISSDDSSSSDDFFFT